MLEALCATRHEEVEWVRICCRKIFVYKTHPELAIIFDRNTGFRDKKESSAACNRKNTDIYSTETLVHYNMIECGRSTWPARRTFDRSNLQSGQSLSVGRPLFPALPSAFTNVDRPHFDAYIPFCYTVVYLQSFPSVHPNPLYKLQLRGCMEESPKGDIRAVLK